MAIYSDAVNYTAVQVWCRAGFGWLLKATFQLLRTGDEFFDNHQNCMLRTQLEPFSTKFVHTIGAFSVCFAKMYLEYVNGIYVNVY